jgi:hypothetical protein
MNSCPSAVQQQQMTNLFTPLWSKMIVPTVLASDQAMSVMSDAFVDMYAQCREMLHNGVSLIEIAGAHPRLSAVLGDWEFERALILSG